MNAAPKRQLKVRPVVFTWTGVTMVPHPRFKALCDQQFAVSEDYPLMIVENRSLASHNHYFAALEEGWKNLAEEYANAFPSPEHLRAHALVEAGYATQTDTVLDTPKDAKQFAVMIRRKDPYAIIRVKGNVVQEFNAESQSMAAMKKDRFEKSKQDVLAIVASMARTTVAELEKNAGRAS